MHTFLVVLEQQRPIARVERRRSGLRLDGIVLLCAFRNEGHLDCMRLLYNTQRLSATWVLWDATEMRRTAEKTRSIAKSFLPKLCAR